MSSPLNTYAISFIKDQQWSFSGAASSWNLQLRYSEFAMSLSTLARVNGRTINISTANSAPGTAFLCLGCSTIIAAYASSSLAYVSAADLLTTAAATLASVVVTITLSGMTMGSMPTA
jgi:hypothetical protein